MGFFSLRSEHTLFLIILGFMGVAFLGVSYYPAYSTYWGYIAIGGIIGLIVFMYVNAVVQGPPHPHIEHTLYDPKSKIAYRTEHLFIETEPEPSKPVQDIWPLMEENPQTKQSVPIRWMSRWWYPYLARTKWSVSFGEFKDVSLHIFLLPHPWKRFLGFGRRKDAAFVMGEEISHGTSTHLVSVLAPFKVDYIGLEIPVYLGICSTFTIEKITSDWETGLNELARVLNDMNSLIDQEKDNIFPKKQLEEMVAIVYPHLRKKE